jgi:hypothetical protein
MVPGVRQPAGLADRHRADDVDEDEQDSQHRDDGPAYDQDPANVADHIAVLLGSPRCQQALAAGAAGPCDFRGSTSVATARPGDLGGPFLGDDLRLELCRSSLLGRGQAAGGLRFEARLGSGGTVPLGMSLARSVRSTSALGHGL